MVLSSSHILKKSVFPSFLVQPSILAGWLSAFPWAWSFRHASVHVWELLRVDENRLEKAWLEEETGGEPHVDSESRPAKGKEDMVDS
jgi:hypothetical protein